MAEVTDQAPSQQLGEKDQGAAHAPTYHLLRGTDGTFSLEDSSYESVELDTELDMISEDLRARTKQSRESWEGTSSCDRAGTGVVC